MSTDNKPLPRKEVLRFAHMMEDRLRDNDHKGGWRDCTAVYLWNRLAQEMNELKIALFDRGDISRESADVANFAMMIHDVFGSDNPSKNGSDK